MESTNDVSPKYLPLLFVFILYLFFFFLSFQLTKNEEHQKLYNFVLQFLCDNEIGEFTVNGLYSSDELMNAMSGCLKTGENTLEETTKELHQKDAKIAELEVQLADKERSDVPPPQDETSDLVTTNCELQAKIEELTRSLNNVKAEKAALEKRDDRKRYLYCDEPPDDGELPCMHRTNCRI